MTEEQLKKALFDFDKNYRLYNDFIVSISDLLKRIISESHIGIQSLSYRVKERDSFKEKCKKDKYSDISQITDIVGIRVITYLTDDVTKIGELIDNEFVVDSQNSLDKHSQLKENEFGYQSVHKIITLPDHRLKLIENNRYKGCVAEVQLRTLLQHAWAEIEHDRKYKSGGVLRPDIGRRFYMSAGVLELVDLEFQRISNDLKKYKEDIKNKTDEGSFDIAIDSTSLFEYMSKKFDFTHVIKTFSGVDDEVINELNNFGIATIKELDGILNQEFLDYMKDTNNSDNNFVGICRDIMIINDAGRYFSNSWKKHWGAADSQTIELWKRFNVDISKVPKRIRMGYIQE